MNLHVRMQFICPFFFYLELVILCQVAGDVSSMQASSVVESGVPMALD